jgi:hypothetical protein
MYTFTWPERDQDVIVLLKSGHTLRGMYVGPSINGKFVGPVAERESEARIGINGILLAVQQGQVILDTTYDQARIRHAQIPHDQIAAIIPDRPHDD